MPEIIITVVNAEELQLKMNFNFGLMNSIICLDDILFHNMSFSIAWKWLLILQI